MKNFHPFSMYFFLIPLFFLSIKPQLEPYSVFAIFRIEIAVVEKSRNGRKNFVLHKKYKIEMEISFSRF